MSRRLQPAKRGYDVGRDAELEQHNMSKKERRIMRRAIKARAAMKQPPQAGAEASDKGETAEPGTVDMTQRPENPRILPVKDGYASKKINHWLWDLPFRLAMVGRSEASGKTTWLLNMLLRFYMPSPWKGRDVYIISGTATADKKVRMLQRRLGIPDANVFSRYSDATLAGIYKKIKERHEKAPHAHSLVLLDDITSNLNATQNGGIMGEMAYEMRHQLGSLILLTQKWTMVPTGLRENLSGAVVWGCAQRQVSALANDLNRFDSANAFYKMVKNCTSSHPHNFLVARLNKPVNEMYLDTHFQPILPRGEGPDDEQAEPDDTDLPAPKRKKVAPH